MAKPSVMVALHCLTDAELLWLHGKIWLPQQQGSVRVVFEWYHYIARPLKPHFDTRTWYLSPIQAELQPIFCANSQLLVTVATRVGRGLIWMTRETEWHRKPPVWYKIWDISYTVRVIADFVCSTQICVLVTFYWQLFSFPVSPAP